MLWKGFISTEFRSRCQDSILLEPNLFTSRSASKPKLIYWQLNSQPILPIRSLVHHMAMSRPGPDTPRFTVIESLFPDGRGAGLALRCHCHLARHYLLSERISSTKSSPLCIRSSFPSFRTPFYHSGHNRAILPSTLSSRHLHHVAAGTRIIPVCSEMMHRQGDYFSTSVTFLYGLISFSNRT